MRRAVTSSGERIALKMNLDFQEAGAFGSAAAASG